MQACKYNLGKSFCFKLLWWNRAVPASYTFPGHLPLVVLLLRLDELVVPESCVCKMLTGELSKGVQPRTCLCNPRPQRAGRAGQDEHLAGMLLHLYHFLRNHWTGILSRGEIFQYLYFFCHYLAASSKPHHCGCLATRSLKWTGQKICLQAQQRKQQGRDTEEKPTPA